MTINYIPMPDITEWELFKRFPIELCKSEKKITVEVSFLSKTRLHVSICAYKASVAVNIIPTGSENFLFDAVGKTSMFSGDKHVAQHFKVTKKQGFKQLEQHIKNTIAHVFQVAESDEFEINIYNSTAIRILQAA